MISPNFNCSCPAGARKPSYILPCMNIGLHVSINVSVSKSRTQWIFIFRRTLFLHVDCLVIFFKSHFLVRNMAHFRSWRKLPALTDFKEHYEPFSPYTSQEIFKHIVSAGHLRTFLRILGSPRIDPVLFSLHFAMILIV